MSIVRYIALLLPLTFLGCATPAPGPTAAPDHFAALEKGLPAAQVIALLGAPAATKPFSTAALNAEVWTYRRKISETVTQVPIRTTDIPYINPRTGQMDTRPEPVYENQHLFVIETVELLIVEQRLIEWKRSRTTETAIY
jgi:hypothetical protein